MRLPGGLSLCLLLLAPLHVAAQWKSTGPAGGTINALVARTTPDTTFLFAGTDGGLFISSNGGASWDRAPEALLATPITRLCTTGDFVYAVTRGGALLRSTDRGASWSRVTTGNLGTNIVHSVSASSNEVVAATTSGGLFLSTDFGLTWITRNAGLPSLRLGPSLVRGALVFTAGPSLGQYSSFDTGATWSSISFTPLLRRTLPSPAYAPLGNPAMQSRFSDEDSVFVWEIFSILNKLADPVGSAAPLPPRLTLSARETNPDTVAFAATVVGLFKSQDLGRSWQKTGLRGGWITGVAARDSTLYAGDILSGTSYSLDTGATWTHFNGGLPDSSIEAMASSPGVVYAATNNGAAASMGRNSPWIPLMSGLNAHNIWGLWTNGPTLFCASQNGRAFRSTDGGAGWLGDLHGFLGGMRAFAADNAYLYAADPLGPGVFRSSDGGSTWNPANTGLTTTSIRALLAGGPVLYAGTGDAGIFVSRDHGNTWAKADTGLPLRDRTSIAALGAVDSTVFLASLQGIYRSTDAGASWQRSDTTFLSAFATSAFQSMGHMLLAGLSGRGVFRTTDWGLTWTPANQGISGETINALAASGNELFAAGLSGKVFASTDSGISWINASQSLAPLPISSMTVHKGSLFVATAGGSVWGRPLSEITLGVGEPASPTIPAGFTLAQNYPNPFNPSTTIEFSLPRRVHVSLAVFNILGQMVSRLVDGDLAAGKHAVHFSASNLASGVYLYRLTSGGYVGSRTLLVIR